MLEGQEQDSSNFLVSARWSIPACSAFTVTVFAAIVYGYHYRRDIDPGLESRIDMSRAYHGGALVAILAPIVHLMIDCFVT